jgi:pyruvate/2-oxoglutarate/acetoin dehydrogenase E1 component
MAELTYRDAVARGIAQEMARDPDVIFFGEDVAKPGGVFKATVGLYEQFDAASAGLLAPAALGEG